MALITRFRQFIQGFSAQGALVLALEQRDVVALHRALLRGPDVHSPLGPTGWTPLHKACADGWVAGVETLLAWAHQRDFVGEQKPHLNTAVLAAPHGMLLVSHLMGKVHVSHPLTRGIFAAIRARLPVADLPLWDLRWPSS